MAKVYVSSTYRDLKDCRESVRLALQRLNQDDVAMETYVAESRRPVDKCLRDVATCDLYIGVFAWRYGYIPPGHDRSITELEYRTALQSGKDCLIFLLSEDAPWPRSWIEKGSGGDHIEALRSELSERHLCSFFGSAQELATLVTTAVANWLRAQAELKDRTPDRTTAVSSTGLLTPPTPEPLASAPAEDTLVHNLGPRHDLLGRAHQVRALLKKLSTLKQPLILFGPPGIGKSSVAIELAYRLARPLRSTPKSHRFGYILFFTARLKPLDLATLLDELARWTDNLYVMKLVDTHDKLIEIKKVLSRTRVLIILDNLESITDQSLYEFIESIPYPSQTLATSRRMHPELPSARHIELPAISDTSSAQLLRRELNATPGSPAFRPSHGRLSQLFARLESLIQGNPLAIKWTAGQLQTLPIESLVNSLDAGRGDLFKNMFESTWNQLSSSARRVLCALTHFRSPPTPDATLSAAAVDMEHSDHVLAELRTSRLLESTRGSYEELRLTLHPLTQAFALSKLIESKPEEQSAIRTAFVDYYESLVTENGGRDWDDPAPFERIDVEHDNCVRAATLANEDMRCDSVVSIVDGLRNYLLIYGYWRERLDLCRLALNAAQALPGSRTRAHFLRHIGWTLVLQGDLNQAEQHLDEAKALARAEGDLKGQADATGDLAEIARLRGNLPLARILRQESLELSKQGGNRRDIYVERALLAQVDLEERHLDAAHDGFVISLSLAKELRWHRAIAYCLHWLGDVARLQGDYALAGSYLSQSRQYVERFHDRARLALIQKSEALLALAEGDIDTARNLARSAVDELSKLGLPYELRELESLASSVETHAT